MPRLSASLPALYTVGLIGRGLVDLQRSSDRACDGPVRSNTVSPLMASAADGGAAPAGDAGCAGNAGTAAAAMAGFVGDIDELRDRSKVARPVGFIKVAAIGQGPTRAS